MNLQTTLFVPTRFEFHYTVHVYTYIPLRMNDIQINFIKSDVQGLFARSVKRSTRVRNLIIFESTQNDGV